MTNNPDPFPTSPLFNKLLNAALLDIADAGFTYEALTIATHFSKFMMLVGAPGSDYRKAWLGLLAQLDSDFYAHQMMKD